MDIQVTWFNELLASLKKSDVKRSINVGITKSLMVLEREAKIQTPVDTWVLRNSYKQEQSSLIGKLINFREYGIYVHEWTRFMVGNPFMQRAIDNSESTIEMIFSKEIDLLLQQL